ncbi:MAG: glycosyltransferase family 2 protein [Deltaproteobacteria bacterium]|nr:glycosyltransferase family 2 protein [Deltaproteobacteria bacterium]
MDLSLVIVNWNTRELLLKCLTSVYETISDLCFEVWLVDNASTDGSLTAVDGRFPKVRLIRNSRNLGFAAANNQALGQIKGRYALLVNTDVVITKGSVQALFRFMEDTVEAGMACGQLLNLDGTKQNSIANLPSPALLLTNETLLRILFPKAYPSKLRRYESPIEVESCIGACLMVRKTAMDAVGLLDERFFFYFEETDWACRMRKAGWKVFFVPAARFFHAQGQSVGHEAQSRLLFYRSRYQYLKKWFPKSYQLMVIAVMLRLLVNTFLTGVGVLFTGFYRPQMTHKFLIYIKILIWHLRGCPLD